MENEDSSKLNINIAKNLKEIRKKKNLTLDALASLSGVSKSMLGQIERGESNPTITVLWKIAVSLHISLTSLLENNKTTVEIIDNNKIDALLNDEGKFRLHPTFPFNSQRNFEMFYIELDPHTHTFSEPHEPGTIEYIIVYEGDFNLIIDEETYCLKEGNAISYDASISHQYLNPTDKLSKICMVIYYE